MKVKHLVFLFLLFFMLAILLRNPNLILADDEIPTETPTPTIEEPTPTDTPSPTPEETITPTEEPTPTDTPTPTETPTPTDEPTPTPTEEITPTTSVTPTDDPSPTPSHTPTPTTPTQSSNTTSSGESTSSSNSSNNTSNQNSNPLQTIPATIVSKISTFIKDGIKEKTQPAKTATPKPATPEARVLGTTVFKSSQKSTINFIEITVLSLFVAMLTELFYFSHKVVLKIKSVKIGYRRHYYMKLKISPHTSNKYHFAENQEL